MSAGEEAAFHNKAVAYAEEARKEMARTQQPHGREAALICAQLSTTYSIMAQTGLLHRIWLEPVVPPEGSQPTGVAA